MSSQCIKERTEENCEVVKHKGHENKESDLQRQSFLMFKPILPTCIIKYTEASEENMHVDVGA